MLPLPVYYYHSCRSCALEHVYFLFLYQFTVQYMYKLHELQETTANQRETSLYLTYEKIQLMGKEKREGEGGREERDFDLYPSSSLN